ncbi:hypothetical protein F383_23517 [Gossypium arboreum]|uniref:Uncharacterized protein n=1 Tax=Gossypium arboreum TaxID=29729 RepID=A0A0B0NZU0_GOSAR|nr:hypothetical protein F383_23517 [Gossypium arboreum]
MSPKHHPRCRSEGSLVKRSIKMYLHLWTLPKNVKAVFYPIAASRTSEIRDHPSTPEISQCGYIISGDAPNCNCFS